MNKKIILSILFSLFITLIFPPSMNYSSSANETVVVSESVVNIRSGPGLSYQIVTKVKKEDKLSVVKTEGDWIKIKTASGKEGWIANWLVTKPKNIITEEKAIILENNLRVRNDAGTTNKVLGSVNKGESYIVYQKKNDWYQIESPYGKGWVSGAYIQLQKTSEPIKEQPSETPVPTKPVETSPTNTPPTSVVIASGKVTTSVLNVRETASTQSKILGKLERNATVSIISQTESWTNITYKDGTAWVSSQYIEKITTPPSETITNKKVKITASILKVRESNSTESKEVGRVKQDQIFKVIDEKNDWISISYENGKTGWIAAWYTTVVEEDLALEPPTSNPTEVVEEPIVITPEQPITPKMVTILNDGTNIRLEPNTASQVVHRSMKNDKFQVIEQVNDWIKIQLADGQFGYVAGWIVTIDGKVPVATQTATEKYLANKTIVIDAGHGGRDSGTIGVTGLKEKTNTLTVAKQLSNALTAAGAKVIMTRTSDTYVSLANRVYVASNNKTDAFISIHFDSINDSSIRGMTTYYYHAANKNLATTVQKAAVNATGMKDRNARYGNYYVLREHSKPSILMELGYLSNATDEAFVQTSSFQVNVVNGIVTGLTNYFK